MQLDSISSPTLVCAMDPVQFGEREKESIISIMVANDFDAIPLIDDRGAITKVVRRRFHDGDPAPEIFVIGPDEVGELLFDEDSTIMEVLTFVLSSEHHVALVGGRAHRDHCRIVTLSSLSNPSVRSYLDHKVADASNSRKTLDAHLGRQIFDQISSQASLASDPASEVSDKEFTSNAARILIGLQPLKNIGRGEADAKVLQGNSHATSEKVKEEPMASEIAIWPMWGVMEDRRNPEIQDNALRSISKANEFTNIAIFRDHGGATRPVAVNSIGKNGRIQKLKFKHQEENNSLRLIIRRLTEQLPKQSEPIVIVKGTEQGGHDGQWGIITIDELRNPSVLDYMMRKFAILEKDIKSYLISSGLKSSELRGEEKEVSRMSLGQLLSVPLKANIKLSRDLKQAIIDSRTTLVHEIYADSGNIDIASWHLSFQAEESLRKQMKSN